MLALSRLGAVILPPQPAFYLHPQDTEDIVRFVVGRILVALNIEEALSEEPAIQGEGKLMDTPPTLPGPVSSA